MKKTHRIFIVITFEVICLLFFVGLYIIRQVKEKQALETAVTADGNKKYIKYVEFNVCYQALDRAYKYDIDTYGKDVHLNWIELLAYLGTKYGGDFKSYKEKDLIKLAKCLLSKEETMESLTKDMKYFDYYLEAYSAVLGGMVGEYEIQEQPNKTDSNQPPEPNGRITDYSDGIIPDSEVEYLLDDAPDDGDGYEKRYGLKCFSPIAKEFYYYGYDDFGVSRSFGYRRQHLGHDMMASVGTPIIAVESGYVEALGWNMYGGWRIGIRSFDGKRYYYYAHMRKNFPYNKSLKEGDIVTAGDVIGYVGRTGYSTTENVNNIETSHLHFGMELIFDEAQKEGNNEIWVDVYALTSFLYRNRSLTVKNEETKEYSRVYQMRDPAVTQFLEQKKIHEPVEGDEGNGIIIDY